MVNILLFIMPFFIYVAIKGIIVSFSFNIHLSPFFLSTFSTLNCFWFVFDLFLQNIPIISLPLGSLITYVPSTVFLTFLITKISSDQFGVYPFAKIFLYVHILIISAIFNLESFSLYSWLESRYFYDFTSTGFILIVLWYEVLHLLMISSNL